MVSDLLRNIALRSVRNLRSKVIGKKTSAGGKDKYSGTLLDVRFLKFCCCVLAVCEEAMTFSFQRNIT